MSSQEFFDMPGHSVTKPSSCASPQEPLHNGKTMKSGNSDPPTKLFDYAKEKKKS